MNNASPGHWRNNQTQPVTVIRLVAQDTIEHRILDTLANKQALADGVLDLKGDLESIRFGSGRQNFIKRLEQLMKPPTDASPSSVPPADPVSDFVEFIRHRASAEITHCEERTLSGSSVAVLLMVSSNSEWLKSHLRPLQQAWATKSQSALPQQALTEVIDDKTLTALQRLSETGLIQSPPSNTRFFPATETKAGEPRFTDQKLRESGNHLKTADREMKVIQTLMDADLQSESSPHVKQALEAIASAWAVLHRVDPPEDRGELLESTVLWSPVETDSIHSILRRKDPLTRKPSRCCGSFGRAHLESRNDSFVPPAGFFAVRQNAHFTRDPADPIFLYTFPKEFGPGFRDLTKSRVVDSGNQIT